MSQLDQVRLFDAQMHAAFEQAGLSDAGQYFAPGSAEGVPCDAFLDRDVQVLGQFSEVLARRDEMGLLIAGVQPAARGRVLITMEGGAIETWHLVDPISDDGSLSRWAVRRV